MRQRNLSFHTFYTFLDLLENAAALCNHVKVLEQRFQKSKHLRWLPDGRPSSEP